MQKPASIAELTDLGRVRLSEHFFMREMLYSEVANFCGVPNYPDEPDLAIQVGRRLCETILEPLRSAFGHVTVRSAFRSATLNGYGNTLFSAGDTASWCSTNDYNYARHIWDRRDGNGRLGGCATIVLPTYLDHFERSKDWRTLGWWIRDNIPVHDEVIFFDHLCAFNIRWYEGDGDQSISYLPTGSADTSNEELLTRRDMPDFASDHSANYAGVMASLGICAPH